MHGVTLCVGEDEKPLWCPLVYEFLPDFFYTCGIIGHIDKACTQTMKEGEIQQFSKKLRFLPEKKRGDDGGMEMAVGGHFTSSWKFGGSGGWYSQWGSGSKNSAGRSGSDAPSWRKEDGSKNKDKGNTAASDGEEVTSPINPAVTIK